MYTHTRTHTHTYTNIHNSKMLYFLEVKSFWPVQYKEPVIDAMIQPKDLTVEVKTCQ